MNIKHNIIFSGSNPISLDRDDQKREEYKEVISLLKRGYSIRNVAKLTGYSIQTVQTIKNQFVNN